MRSRCDSYIALHAARQRSCQLHADGEADERRQGAVGNGRREGDVDPRILFVVVDGDQVLLSPRLLARTIKRKFNASDYAQPYLNDIELFECVRMLGVVDIADVVEHLASIHRIRNAFVVVVLTSFSFSRFQIGVHCRRHVVQSFFSHSGC